MTLDYMTCYQDVIHNSVQITLLYIAIYKLKTIYSEFPRSNTNKIDVHNIKVKKINKKKSNNIRMFNLIE